MKTTDEPIEIASLLNASYCAVALNGAAEGYKERSSSSLPLSLSFLILPIVLHGRTMQIMPSTSSAKFVNWIFHNKFILLGFPERAKRLVPFTQTALVYGIKTELIQLDNSGVHAKANLKSRAPKVNDSVREVYVNSKRLGSMLAQAGTPSTIYALLGVAP